MELIGKRRIHVCGFPLFSGFVSKGLIMNAIAESGRPLTEILMLIASVGTLLSVGLKVNYFVFFAKPHPAGAAHMTEAAHTQRCLAEAIAGALSVRPELVLRNMRLAMLLGAAGDRCVPADHAGCDAVSLRWTPVYGRSYHAVPGTLRGGGDCLCDVSFAYGAA